MTEEIIEARDPDGMIPPRLMPLCKGVVSVEDWVAAGELDESMVVCTGSDWELEPVRALPVPLL